MLLVSPLGFIIHIALHWLLNVSIAHLFSLNLTLTHLTSPKLTRKAALLTFPSEWRFHSVEDSGMITICCY